MRKSLQRFLTHCLKKEYLSRDHYNTIQKLHAKFEKQGKVVGIYNLMAKLGWDKNKVETIVKEIRAQGIVGESTALKLPLIPKRLNTGISDLPEKRMTKRMTKSEGECRRITRRISKEKEFGNYILVEKLGEGGMGAVYKAYHPTFKSYFALKMIISNKVGEEGLRRFEREARVCFKLKHPNIVHVHDVGKQEGKHYIAMDYIEGKDLGKLIHEKRFWPRRAFEIVLLITRALQYSHKQGIIHRDIKPSNIIVANENGKEIPYLCDFGLASVVKEEGLTRTGEIMGTPYYMSPEQTKGMKRIDGRTDIYSLGVVLYEMLAGKQMIEADRTMAIFYEVVHKDPPLISKCVPGIAKDVEAITMKCIEKEPSRRYQTTGELAEDIERYLRGEVVLARSPGLLYRLWRNIGRKKMFSAVVLFSILLVTGVLLFLMLSAPDQTEIKIASLMEQAIDLEKHGNLEGAVNIYFKLKKNHEQAMNSLNRIKNKIKDEAANYERNENLKEAKKNYDILGFDEDYKPAKDGITRIKNKIEEEWKKANGLGAEKNFDKALELCRKLIAWDPKDKRFASYILELDQNKESCRKKARKYYDRAMEVFWNPNLNEKEIEKCKELFEKAINEDPTFAEAHFQAGRASHRLFNITQAIEHYKKSQKYDSTLNPPKYYLTALELPLIYEKNVRQISEDQIIHKLDEQFAETWNDSKAKIPYTPKKNDPYLLLAKAQLLLVKLNTLKYGDPKQYHTIWKECMEYCKNVIKVAPTFSDAYFVRAQLNSYIVEIRQNASHDIHISNNPMDLNQALRDCAQGIYLDPFRMEFYSLRGVIYQTIGSYDLAEKDYTKALLLKNVSKADFYLNRAICYSAMEKIDLAVQDLTQNLELTKKYELFAHRLRESFIWRALSKACLKDKKGAEEDLNNFFRLSQPDKNLFGSEDGEIYKTIIYMFIDDKTDRTENAWKKFLLRRPNDLKKMQLLLIALTGGKESATYFIQNITLLMQNIPNLFCVQPELKNALPELKRFREAVSRAASLLRGMETKGFFDQNYGHLQHVQRSVVTRSCLNILHKDPMGKEKQNRLNMIFQKDYPPLTADFFLYCFTYLNEGGYIKNLLNLKELPSAPLYYRRAIEHYIEKSYDKAMQDLKEALEFEPNYMEAHYGLSTIYSVFYGNEKDTSKKLAYRELAMYHLKRAIENGWSHIDDYTLKDENFKPLELEEKASLEKIMSWNRKREENERQIKEFGKDLKELISSDKLIRALRLLYNPHPVFFSKLNDFVVSTEKEVMKQFLKEENEKNSADLDRKIETLFGERGKIAWEWAKRGN